MFSLLLHNFIQKKSQRYFRYAMLKSIKREYTISARLFLLLGIVASLNALKRVPTTVTSMLCNMICIRVTLYDQFSAWNEFILDVSVELRIKASTPVVVFSLIYIE